MFKDFTTRRESLLANIELCRAVETHPVLYDCSHEHHWRKSHIRDAWTKVAATCKSTPIDCKKRWSYIKVGFIRAIIRGSCDYYLQDYVEFVRPHLTYFTRDKTRKPYTKKPKLTTTSQSPSSDSHEDEALKENLDSESEIMTDSLSTMEMDEDESVENIEKILKSKQNGVEDKKAETSSKTKTDNEQLGRSRRRERRETIDDPLKMNTTRVLRGAKRLLDKSADEHKTNNYNDAVKSKEQNRKSLPAGPSPASKKRRQQQQTQQPAVTSSSSTSPMKAFESTDTNSSSNSSTQPSSVEPTPTPKAKDAEEESPPASDEQLLEVDPIAIVTNSATSTADLTQIEAEIPESNGNSLLKRWPAPFVSKEEPVEKEPTEADNEQPLEVEKEEEEQEEEEQPEYYDDLLQLAAEKAKEYEAEELRRLNAPPAADKAIQCHMPQPALNLDFLDEIKTRMEDMNPRQQLDFKQRTYKNLIDVFDNASDFPGHGLGTAMNERPMQQIMDKLLPREQLLIRELASFVMAVKKSPEFANAPIVVEDDKQQTVGSAASLGGSAGKTGAAVAASASAANTNVKQTATVRAESVAAFQLKYPGAKIVRPTTHFSKSLSSNSLGTSPNAANSASASSTTVSSSSGPVYHVIGGPDTDLPQSLVNEAIKLSENGGGNLATMDGNTRRVFRIYPKQTTSKQTNAAVANASTAANTAGALQNTRNGPQSGTLIIPHSAMNTMSTSAPQMAVAPLKSGAAASSRTVTISGRPVVVNSAMLANGRIITPPDRNTTPNSSSSSSSAASSSKLTGVSPIRIGQTKYTASNDSAGGAHLNGNAANNRSVVTLRRVQDQIQLQQAQRAAQAAATPFPLQDMSQIKPSPTAARPMLRRYSMCTPTGISSLNLQQQQQQQQQQQSSQRSAAASIITTTIHGSPMTQVATMSHESHRRNNNDLIVSYKRSRYPHAANAVTTSRVSLSSVSSGSSPIRQTGSSQNESLLKPVNVQQRVDFEDFMRATELSGDRSILNTSAAREAAAIAKNARRAAAMAQEDNDSNGLISADEFLNSIVKQEPLDDEMLLL